MKQPEAPDFLPGTLDMLVLKTLSLGANHGWGIAQRIQQISRESLRIGEGSLYPALQRLLLNGHVTAEWGLSENNRRARFYTITAAGSKRLAREKEDFQLLIAAIERVLEAS